MKENIPQYDKNARMDRSDPKYRQLCDIFYATQFFLYQENLGIIQETEFALLDDQPPTERKRLESILESKRKHNSLLVKAMDDWMQETLNYVPATNNKK